MCYFSSVTTNKIVSVCFYCKIYKLCCFFLIRSLEKTEIAVMFAFFKIAFGRLHVRKLRGETYVLLKPSWDPDPTKLDLSEVRLECWEPWLKRTLLSWGGLSSLWAKNSSYCLFVDAETTWNRMSGRRMACLKMLWALEARETEMGEDVCVTGCWCGNMSSCFFYSNLEEDAMR